MYVIYKLSRGPRGDSYSGPTWDAAGIRDKYKATYEDRYEAEELARLLSRFNMVGFGVQNCD